MIQYLQILTLIMFFLKYKNVITILTDWMHMFTDHSMWEYKISNSMMRNGIWSDLSTFYSTYRSENAMYDEKW